ncbi:MAG: glycosyltransferase family 9 protein [Acidobacteriota bacterium]
MRFLIIKLSAIGDVVHTLPAVAFLKRSLPDAEIAWAVEPKAAAILEGSPVIDELIILDTKSLKKNIFSGSVAQKIEKQLFAPKKFSSFDVAIDFQGLLKSGLVTKASKADRRIGFEDADLREKISRRFLTEQIHTAGFAHVIEKNLAVARAAINRSLELPSPDRYEFPIAISLEDEQYIHEHALNQTLQFAILNPGGGWTTKLWDAKNFGAVADFLWENYQLMSFVTFGPGEEALAQSVAQSSRIKKAIPLPSTLKQFVALARQAKIFIGGDTGPLHLAAACRTPIVGLFAPTEAKRNGAFAKCDINLGLELWCREHCHRRHCWHWQCMEIPLEKVCEAVVKRLKNAKTVNEKMQQPLAFNV